jgi:FtsP/CotA-like multicopper oxidase with cupredoxin domain
VRLTSAFIVTVVVCSLSGLALAGEYDLVIAKKAINITGQVRMVPVINGTLPGPTLRWREGEDVILRVINRLDTPTSIHWHGIILPADMDGVPDISFPGILPGDTFTYRFQVKQSGTYWYHSHSGFQEQEGMYAPIVIAPARPEPYRYDRDYVVMLSDWTDENPHRIFARLKKLTGYYNFQKRTVFDFFHDAATTGWGSTIADRFAWSRMRMDPTDIADVTGYTYTYLVNGNAPAANWTGLFTPGERVRLRFINGSSMSYFDVRIPGLKMTVVQADGQDIDPVTVDEFRIAVAETYDVIAEPENRAYTVFAESMDRSGHARGTLAPRYGMKAPVPERRPRPLLTMADMGMDHGAMAHGAPEPGRTSAEAGTATTPAMNHDGADHDATMNHGAMGHEAANHGAMDHGVLADDGVQPLLHGPDHRGQGTARGHGTSETSQARGETGAGGTPAMDHGGAHHDATMDHGAMDHGVPADDGMQPLVHGPDHHGPGNAMVAMVAKSRLHESGLGLENTPDHRVLLYSDLRSREPGYDRRIPGREIELHLTGNMERFMWSFDGKKFSEADPIRLRYGERVRFTLVNDTMMNHPIHLHGMWSELVNGAGAHQPRKHVINVKPAERVSFDLTADARGEWAFHCHLLYHMDAGMFRRVVVADPDAERSPDEPGMPEEPHP